MKDGRDPSRRHRAGVHGQTDCLSSVLGLAHHLDIGVEAKEHPKALADNAMIVDDQNTDLFQPFRSAAAYASRGFERDPSHPKVGGAIAFLGGMFSTRTEVMLCL